MSLVTPKKGYKSVPWLFGKEIEIPQEWEVETVEMITSQITYGLTVRPQFVEKGIPLISAREIRTGKINFADAPKISKEDFSNLSEKCKGTNNDLFFSKTGTIGYVAKVETVDNFAITQNIASLSPKLNKIISEFFEWVLHSNYFHKSCFRTINTTTIMDLQLGELGKINVCIPPLLEQQKIATILSNVDNLIETTEQVITTSKKVKKGLMQKLLTRGIGHTKFKKVPWLFGKEIEIPQEWEVLPLSEVCSIRETNSVKSNLYIGLEHINQNDNKLVGQSTTEEFTSNTNSFYNDDILYGKLRPLLNKVWLATEEGNCSTDILPLQTKENIIPTILLLVLTDYRFFWFAVSTSSGTKMPRTNWSDMKNFLVFLPSVTEQQKIASILSNIDSKITSQEQYKEKLERLKKSLMQKLLTGEVRV